jgi:hypothetical protein
MEQQQLAGQSKDTHQQEGMQREEVAGHTVAVLHMAVLLGVHMGCLLKACVVSLKNERNCISIKHCHHHT